MTRVQPPPSPFPPINHQRFDAGKMLHRTHARALRPAEFNPCRGQPSRFAPFNAKVSGTCVPTLYAATSREAAAFESIFHDIDPMAAFKTVPLDAVEARSVSMIRPRRNLRLARLFTPDLKVWRIERRHLVDTPKSTYAQTALWAAAIHDADQTIEGLIWTSRQCDPDRCLVLFGDRVSESDFEVMERREVAFDATLLLELREFGRRAGITMVS